MYSCKGWQSKNGNARAMKKLVKLVLHNKMPKIKPIFGISPLNSKTVALFGTAKTLR